jgi:DNA-binding transcriptional ArsR family regulator
MSDSGFSKRNNSLLVALRHPLRRAILRAMADGEAVNPRELAELLGERLSTVAYHVKVLAKCGAVAPAGDESVEGATKHFYRRSLEEEWAKEMLDQDEEKPPKDES